MAEATVPSGYVPGKVEVVGRRLKMEYVGMASVFAVVCLAFFGDLAAWYDSVAATGGVFFLFLGIKKKTRDHLCASFLLFAAASLARGLARDSGWSVPYFLAGASVFIMERHLEKPRNQIHALPVVLGLWGAIDSSWWLGLAFAALYLTHPWVERPGLRRRLGSLVALSAGVGVAASFLRARSLESALRAWLDGRLALAAPDFALLASVGVPTLLALAFYGRRLPAPHRSTALVFLPAALWDVRYLAFSGMTAAVLLSATLFRQSVDSTALRPAFKHAEWHFFWYVLAVAIWAAARS